MHEETFYGDLLFGSGRSPRFEVIDKNTISDQVIFEDEFLPPITARKMGDWNGEYRELRRIRNAGIDAQVLRHSFFHDVGTDLLYRCNRFYFKSSTAAETYRMTRQEECEALYSKTLKPLLGRRFSTPELQRDWEREVPNIVDHLLWQIGQGLDIARSMPFKSDPSLMLWAERDPFIYFVWLMWPNKAVLLRELAFEGIIKLHDCHNLCRLNLESCRRGCFVDSLRIYVRVINAFCPNLTHLTLYVRADSSWATRMINTAQVLVPMTIERVLGPFLATEVRKISNLKCLKVVGRPGDDMSFADDTIEWVRANANCRAQDSGKTAAMVQKVVVVEVPGMKCGFSGERHNWAKCPLLCPFCGQRGHTNRDCKKWPRARME